VPARLELVEMTIIGHEIEQEDLHRSPRLLRAAPRMNEMP